MKRQSLLMMMLGLSMLSCGGEESVLDTSDPDKGGSKTGRDSDDAKDDSDKTSTSSDGGKKRDSGTSKRDGGTSTSTSSDGSCDSINISARPNSPNILIVLDRSGSMVGLGARNVGKNRWVPSVNAVQKVTSQLTETVAFGLMTFPSRGGGGGLLGGLPGLGGAGTCTPGVVDVPVAVNSAAAIARTLQMSGPDIGATPTAKTLEAALSALTSQSCADCEEAPKFVLLVTDGQPTCGASGLAETTPEDIAAATAAIDRLSQASIKTYVVGYDTSDPESASTMDQFAMHGGTGKHIPVENESTLVNELTRITASLVPCEYELSSDIEDPKYVRVTIDGKQHNLSDGAWRIEGRKIILEGACDSIRDAKIHKLSIVRECTPVDVI